MEQDKPSKFNSALEQKLYDELRFTVQAKLEGEDLSNEAERGTMLFYLGEIDQSMWGVMMGRKNGHFIINNALSTWKKENNLLLDDFKKQDLGKNGHWLREWWM